MRALLFAVLALVPLRVAAASDPLPTIEDKTSGMQKWDGYFPLYWDEGSGKLWLGISRFDEEFLYVHALSTGLGSNPVGLDRGQLGRDRVVKFQRFGPRVLLVQPNLRYRADTADDTERRAVQESFAQSVLWGGEVAAESGGAVLVDAGSLFLRDVHGVSDTLRNAGQGSYQMDSARSVYYLPRTKAFPENIEIETLLTFAANAQPGRLVSETAPSADSVTLRQHHSFIRLPSGYTPRRQDPRSGAFGIVYSDYASPLDQPLRKRFLSRHRLVKRDPAAAVSEPVEPIVYYVDPGAPPLIRQALIEGASWWNQAFEAAGFRNAFRVEVLPPGADPLDVRYNVIQWVHRSTRGWSYGASVTDPRTGEILKGHVSLGSLRVRQDRLIFEGLNPKLASSSLDSATCDAGASPGMEFLAQLDPESTPVDAALARIRQLAAHEVGHTLGFAHNFAASSYGRESVMDYPAPLVTLRSDGSLDLTRAYDVGIGEWDKIAVRYSYAQFPSESDEEAGLESIIQEAIAKGYLFISDADARPAGAAHPLASLWDNGEDPVAALRDTLRVRRAALDRFDASNLASGRPLAELQNTLVPLFLHHRYQAEATAKMLGGTYFTYALRGDGQRGAWFPSPEQQRRALGVLLDALDPAEISIPPRLLGSLPPLPPGYSDERERFAGETGPVYDPLASTRTAADIVLDAVLQHQRAARMETLESLDENNLGLSETIDRLFDATWGRVQPSDAWQSAAERVIQRSALEHLMDLAGNPRAAERARAVAAYKLRDWLDRLEDAGEGFSPADQAHRRLAIEDIRRFLARPAPEARPPDALPAPPGSPIGSPRNGGVRQPPR